MIPKIVEKCKCFFKNFSFDFNIDILTKKRYNGK